MTLTYMDIGHRAAPDAVELWFAERGQLCFEPIGARRSHEHIFAERPLLNPIFGRVDHAACRISVARPGDRRFDRQVDRIIDLLSAKYPDYRVVVFGADNKTNKNELVESR